MAIKLNRFGDLSKFITDASKLELKFGEEVTMSENKDYTALFSILRTRLAVLRSCVRL